MREMINYIFEANTALLMFLIFYHWILRHETNFSFARFYILAAIFISLVFPLFHLNYNQAVKIPTVTEMVPEYWLPVIVIGDSESAIQEPITNAAYDIWQFAGWLYLIGVGIFFAWLIVQLSFLWITLKNAISYKLSSFQIFESQEDKPTFSFFHLIYIGRSEELT